MVGRGDRAERVVVQWQWWGAAAALETAVVAAESGCGVAWNRHARGVVPWVLWRHGRKKSLDPPRLPAEFKHISKRRKRN